MVRSGLSISPPDWVNAIKLGPRRVRWSLRGVVVVGWAGGGGVRGGGCEVIDWTVVFYVPSRSPCAEAPVSSCGRREHHPLQIPLESYQPSRRRGRGGVLPARQKGREGGVLPARQKGREGGVLPARQKGREGGVLPAR